MATAKTVDVSIDVYVVECVSPGFNSSIGVAASFSEALKLISIYASTRDTEDRIVKHPDNLVIKNLLRNDLWRVYTEPSLGATYYISRFNLPL